MAISCLAWGGTACAQGDAALAGMDWVPAFTETLPHRRPVGSGFLAFPAVNAVWSTNWLQPAQWLSTNEEGTTLNINAFLDDVHEENRAALEVHADVLALGFAFGNQRQHWLSAGIQETVSGQVTLPGALLRLPLEGNAAAGSAALDGLSARFDHFRRYTIGLQSQLAPHWQGGLRIHHLRGFEHLAVRDAAFDWETDPADYAWSFGGGAALETAGVAALWDTVDGNAAWERGTRAYLQEAGSPGWGLDAGVAYHPNERWAFEASFTGAGRIDWERDTWTARWEVPQTDFDGIALGTWALDPQVLEDSAAAWAAEWSGWTAEALEAEESTAAFSSWLPGLWLGQIRRTLNTSASAQLTFRHTPIHGTTLAAGATWNVGRALQCNTTYSHGSSQRSLGAGLAVRFGGLLWYTACDNLLAFRVAAIEWNGETAAWIPLDASRIAVRTGLAWVFGRPRKEPTPHIAQPSSRFPG